MEVQEVGQQEGDRLILVQSRGCAQKEKGIHDRMLTKLKAHLERLQNTVRKGRLVNPEKIDADRIDPGTPSGGVELGVRAPRGTSRKRSGDRLKKQEAARQAVSGGALMPAE